MGGLFRKAYPHLVLLGALGRCHGEVDNENEGQHYDYLDVGIEAEAFQQPRVFVVEMLVVAGRDYDVDHVGRSAQLNELFFEEGAVGGTYIERIERVDRLGKVEVAVVDDVSRVVGQKHWDGAVFLDDSEQEVEVAGVGGGIGCRNVIYDLAGCVGPYLHTSALLLAELLDQRVAEGEEKADYGNRHHEKGDGAVAPCFINAEAHFLAGSSMRNLSPVWLTIER